MPRAEALPANAALGQQPPPLLQMRNVSKTFGAFRALDGVHLEAWAGEVHGLMGENGAGKSTLMKILSGAYHADRGAEVLMDGQPVQLGSPQRARAHGIAVIYQELSLAPNLTVLENLFLGAEPTRLGLLMDRAAMLRRAAPVLEQLGMDVLPTQRVASLSLGERQMVEIARAMMASARVVVMDEPTTSLSARESEKLFDIIARLKRDGIAVLYISHRMEEVYRLCDRVSVLRDGAHVGSLQRDELHAARLVSMMVGRDASSFYQKAESVPAAGEAVLTVRDMADGVRVHGCSLEVRAGEVLGIAGLVGAGRTELARLICAAGRKTRGQVFLHGKELRLHTPGQAIAAGIAYLSEDRKAAGLFLDMSVAENINIGVLAQTPALPGLRHLARERARTAQAMQELGVRAASSGMRVGALSGGNQQKVLLARLLQTRPQALILDEPTRGVDVGAKSEIYRIIDALARSGVAVVVISSDLPEILGIATRVLVMRAGSVAGEVGMHGSGREQQAEAIMRLATGVRTDTSDEPECKYL